MLPKIFLSILKMSFTASYVILLVMIIRFFLKKSPKIFSYVLWIVVLFRLISPFTFESIISLVPPIHNYDSYIIVNTDISTNTITPPSENISKSPITPENNEIISNPEFKPNINSSFILSASIIWVSGTIFLIVKNVVGVRKLKKKIKNSQKICGNIYVSDNINTAFVMGIFKPQIYIPSNLTPEESDYIILHEQTHIKRFDHIIKILAFGVLCIHWFNPFVWLAFFASTQDMEMSCDEKVIKFLGNGIKKDYSRSLLSLATGKKTVRGVPLAFGEGDTKGRIKNILNYKKPAFWAIISLVILIVILSISLVSNRKVKEVSASYSGQDAVIMDIDRENKIITASSLHKNSQFYPVFFAKYDDKTSIIRVDSFSDIEDLSVKDLTIGQKIVFTLENVEKNDYVTAYASTIQINEEKILDSNGKDLLPVIHELWYKVNNAYNVDALSGGNNVFTIGETINPENSPEYNELTNYEEAVNNIFTGKAKDAFESGKLIKNINGKYYRLGPWKTGYSYENALTGISVKKQSDDRVTMLMQYILLGINTEDNNFEYGYTYLTIKKIGEKWLVDQYYFPEASQLGFPESEICHIVKEDADFILKNNFSEENIKIEYTGSAKSEIDDCYIYNVITDEGKMQAAVNKKNGTVTIIADEKPVVNSDKNDIILHHLIFPNNIAEKNDANSEIFDITPFSVNIGLPKDYSIKNENTDSKYSCDGLFNMLYIYNEKDEVIGSVGYCTYNANEYEQSSNRYRMMIYSPIAMANHYQFALGDDMGQVISQNRLNETILTDVYISAQVGSSMGYNGERNNIGIVSNNQKSGVFIAIELDSEKISKETAVKIAESIIFDDVYENPNTTQSDTNPEENSKDTEKLKTKLFKAAEQASDIKTYLLDTLPQNDHGGIFENTFFEEKNKVIIKIYTVNEESIKKAIESYPNEYYKDIIEFEFPKAPYSYQSLINMYEKIPKIKKEKNEMIFADNRGDNFINIHIISPLPGKLKEKVLDILEEENIPLNMVDINEEEREWGENENPTT